VATVANSGRGGDEKEAAVVATMANPGRGGDQKEAAVVATMANPDLEVRSLRNATT
jgi:hypothetical protein